MRALVVDPSDARSGLAGVRALARAGWTVGVAGGSPRSLAASSRWCRRWHRVPLPDADRQGFVSAINAAVAQGGYEVALPAGDAEALALSGERHRIAATVPYPPHDVVLRAFDKLQLADAAARAGVPTPATAVVPVGAAIPAALPLPIMVKERVHAGTGDAEGPRIEAAVATTAADATRRVAAVHAAGGDAVLQEVVAGRLIAHASVTAADGSLLAAVQQEAERIFPRESGASARARTVPLEPVLTQHAMRLLEELRWSGLAQLQFLTAPGSPPQLIDFNGRFYGSLALAVGAGADLPAIWAAMATGRATGGRRDARAGVRYQWLEGDLRVATANRGGPLLRELLDCLGYAPGARHAIWSAADPLPPIREAARLARQEAPNLRRLARKVRR